MVGGDDVRRGARTARLNRLLWRAPIAAVAIASLAYGAWLGLLRLGWILPLPWPDHLILHGPLMIGGFLGTLVGLERAVGVGRPWAYAAPILSASGAALLVVGPAGPLAPLLITSASAIVTLVFVRIVSQHSTLFSWTMLAGAVAWLVGNVLWCGGSAIYRVVFWWIAFLVLTIAGERLELSRLLRPSRRVRAAFVVTLFVTAVGIALAPRWPVFGVRIAGTGFVALTAWLAVNDVARRTIRQHGVTRYIAICMLSAYGWLAVAGAIALATGAFDPGPVHDAILHAVFLGFAMTMVFGHAPIVLPAVAGSALRFGAIFYAPYALLQVSVAIRLTGDLVDTLGRLRPWGGLLNALALLLFVVTIATRRGRAAGSENPAYVRP